jgi:hypothetical protein
MNMVVSALNDRIKNAVKLNPQAALRELSQAADTLSQADRERLEAVVLTDWRSAFTYASTVLNGRWQAFENAVEASPPTNNETDGLQVVKYARHVMKDTWPAAEKHIENDGVLSAQYAMWVRKSAWDADSKAMEAINKDREGFELYHSYLDSTGPLVMR